MVAETQGKVVKARTQNRGTRLPLSLPRRSIIDMMHASRNIPIITFERRMNLSPLVAARQALPHPPAWSVLFARGFARVAEHRPEFRRTYLPIPWPHLWEAPESIASIAVEREYRGEPGVFFGMLDAPEKRTLSDLSDVVCGWKCKPIESIPRFDRMIRYARMPLPCRRFLWWFARSWSGRMKARNFGTFGVSLTGGAGATASNLIGPITTTISCGVIQPDGAVDVRVHFDHRVIDGMPAARALAELEEVLRSETADEVRRLRPGLTETAFQAEVQPTLSRWMVRYQ